MSDLNQAAKIIRKVKDSKCSITIKDVDDVKDWYIEVSTDASLWVPVSWFCNKISRVLDSTLAAECLSLKEGLHEAIYVRQVNEELFGLKDKSVPVHRIMDNKGTVDAVHSTVSVSDKKLRRDVAIAQFSGAQLADCVTKKGAPAWVEHQLSIQC